MLAAVTAGLFLAIATGVTSAPAWTVWTVADSGSPAATTMAVGSLSKPFVVEAWARSHRGEAPVIECHRASGCWRPSGHGRVDLRRATAVSCNTYFKALAAATRPDDLTSALQKAGFVLETPPTPERAIGLPTHDGPALQIAPSDLLAAYRRLVREPWALGDTHRRVLLSGLQDAAVEGTAAALRRRGLWAKTGTVRSPQGPAWRTAGLALVVDGAGWASLGLLDPGTGREAAQRMTAIIDAHTATTGTRTPTTARQPTAQGRTPARGARAGAIDAPGRVRVRLFGLLRPKRVTAANVGPAPIATSAGFIGPGNHRELAPGDHLDSGAWELRLDAFSSVRRIDGALDVAGTADRLDVVATITRRAYADGVVLAELGAAASQRVALAAAVLRLLAEGPRHRGADVCDSTHCAWFLGGGPYVRWPAPRRAVVEGTPRPLTDAEWREVPALAQRPGPSRWTSDCGGEPLSSHAVWGGGDHRVADRHHHAVKRWERTWTDSDVARAFGEGVIGLSVTWPNGTWHLGVERSNGPPKLLVYDAAHERIAGQLGWGGLPSPAHRVSRLAGGYRAEGVGLGHRVGLCLRQGTSDTAQDQPRRITHADVGQ